MSKKKVVPNYDTSRELPVDWLQFYNADEDIDVRVNLSFLSSNWKCLFGCGCPGLFGSDSKHTVPDVGCCTDGFYEFDKDEREQINGIVKNLTDEDWDKELRAAYEVTGKWQMKVASGEVGKNGKPKMVRKSRVVDGACIFANRKGGSADKPGCALLHFGVRNYGKDQDVNDNSAQHEIFMPRVCSSLPLRTRYEDDNTVLVIDAWHVNQWHEGVPYDPETGTNEEHAQWWCVDSPDAYVNSYGKGIPKPVVVSMERELRFWLGDKHYEMVRDLVLARINGVSVQPMPASAEGRRLLPMSSPARTQTVAHQIGDRTPLR